MFLEGLGQELRRDLNNITDNFKIQILAGIIESVTKFPTKLILPLVLWVIIKGISLREKCV